MAPLPDNLTNRYWLDYEGAYGKHSIMLRTAAGTFDEDVVPQIEDLAQLLKVFMVTTTAITGLRKSAPNSNVSFPLPWTPVQGTNTTPVSQDQAPEFISFVGRSIDGRRVRYFLNGVPTNVDANYRVLYGESSQIDAVIDFFSSVDTPFVTVSGFVPVMNQYANLGYNAYFQRKRRKA